VNSVLYGQNSNERVVFCSFEMVYIGLWYYLNKHHSLNYSTLSTQIKKRLLVFILILLIFIASGTIRIPHSVKGPCMLEPSAVWYLSHDGAGQLVTGWKHNLIDAGGEQVLLQFNRPDFVDVLLSPELKEGCIVKIGDTLAVIVSHEGLGQIKINEAKLQLSRAELNLLLAGTRPEDINIAKQTVSSAEIGKNALLPEYERIKAQYEAGAATLSELQDIEGRYRQFEAEQKLAESELKALEAGTRPEDITIAMKEIESIQASLEMARFTTGITRPVTAPISGRVKLGGSSGSVIHIERIDTLAVLIKLPETSLNLLKENQTIEIILASEISNILKTTLKRINFSKDEATGAYYGPCGIAFLPNNDYRLHTGMTGNASLDTGKRTLFSVIKTKFTSKTVTAF
jgi:hypothetical protein